MHGSKGADAKGFYYVDEAECNEKCGLTNRLGRLPTDVRGEVLNALGRQRGLPLLRSLSTKWKAETALEDQRLLDRLGRLYLASPLTGNDEADAARLERAKQLEDDLYRKQGDSRARPALFGLLWEQAIRLANLQAAAVKRPVADREDDDKEESPLAEALAEERWRVLRLADRVVARFSPHQELPDPTELWEDAVWRASGHMMETLLALVAAGRGAGGGLIELLGANAQELASSHLWSSSRNVSAYAEVAGSRVNVNRWRVIAAIAKELARPEADETSANVEMLCYLIGNAQPWASAQLETFGNFKLGFVRNRAAFAALADAIRRNPGDDREAVSLVGQKAFRDALEVANPAAVDYCLQFRWAALPSPAPSPDRDALESFVQQLFVPPWSGSGSAWNRYDQAKCLLLLLRHGLRVQDMKAKLPPPYDNSAPPLARAVLLSDLLPIANFELFGVLCDRFLPPRLGKGDYRQLELGLSATLVRLALYPNTQEPDQVVAMVRQAVRMDMDPWQMARLQLGAWMRNMDDAALRSLFADTDMMASLERAAASGQDHQATANLAPARELLALSREQNG